MKRVDPANVIWRCEYGKMRFDKVDGMCVESERIGRIWKNLFPQPDGAFRGADADASEKVLSSPQNPRFGDDAAHFERSRFIAQVVDDEIE